MEAKQMSQVPVQWVYETFDEKPPAIPANGSYVVSAPLDHDILPHAVVPLSALRKWLEDERELSINHGEEGYVSILSLLASLGE